jgi:hypothetical protein
MLDLIARHRTDADLLIGGDFNITLGRRHASGGPTPRADLAVLDRLRDEFGLVNCWEAANSGVQPAQTLRWTGAPTVPYHCDGIFVPTAWQAALRSCVVVGSEEWAGLSDHNPVVATLEAGG